LEWHVDKVGGTDDFLYIADYCLANANQTGAFRIADQIHPGEFV